VNSSVPRLFLALALPLLIWACYPKHNDETIIEKIILDTDMGSDCDDLGALALLHGYQQEGRAEIVAMVYSSGRVAYGVGVVDAVNTSFGMGDIPLGAYHGHDVGDPEDKMDAQSLAIDTALYGHDIIRNGDAPEQTQLLRQILAKQPDSSVTYVTIGHTKALYDLMFSTPDAISPLSGTDLIRRKLMRWVALGALNAKNDFGYFVKDWNLFFNGAAVCSKYLVENFPVPVYFVDGGGDVLTGAPLSQLPETNILRRGYEQWLRKVEEKTLADQRPSWDLVTIYFAIEGVDPFFYPAESGWLEFDTLRGCRWHPGKNEGRYFVKQKDGVSNALADYLNERLEAAALLMKH
jgi:hypothetical protein